MLRALVALRALKRSLLPRKHASALYKEACFLLSRVLSYVPQHIGC